MVSESLERMVLRFGRRWSPLALVLIFSFSGHGNAAEVKQARFTALFGNVTTQSVTAGRRPATLNNGLGDNTTVHTGPKAHTELTFADLSVARLWANTTLNLRDGGRNLFLKEGAIFCDVPTGVELASVTATGVVVELPGASVVFEYHPQVFKLLVVKGTARLYRPDHVGDSVLVSAGQLVFGNPNAALSDPVDFDIKHFLKTSRFITDFPALRNQGLIASEIQKQELAKSQKILIETNLVLYGGGTTVSAVGGKSSTESRAVTPKRRPRQKSVNPSQ